MFIKNHYLPIGMKMIRRKMNKKGMLGQLIGAFIVILVGITLIPLIYQQVTKAQTQLAINNTEGGFGINSESSMAVLSLTPVFFALSIIVIVIMVVTTTLRSAGLLGSSDDGDSDKEDEYKDIIKPKKVKKHKQTYIEFVQERLAVERMMRKQDGFFWWLRK